MQSTMPPPLEPQPTHPPPVPPQQQPPRPRRGLAIGLALALTAVFVAVWDRRNVEAGAVADQAEQQRVEAEAARRAEESARMERERAGRLAAAREDAKLLKKMADGLGMSAVVLETDVEELSPWVGMVSVPEAWWERMTPVEQKSFTRGLRRVWGKLHGPAAGGQEKCRLKIYASFPGGVREVAHTRILDPESVELSD